MPSLQFNKPKYKVKYLPQGKTLKLMRIKLYIHYIIIYPICQLFYTKISKLALLECVLILY